MNKSKTIATQGILITLCLILSYVETLIPFNFAIPGVKLGLSNIVVLFALYKLGTNHAFFINLIRILIISMLFSNPLTMIYSLAGGLLSFVAMVLTKKVKFLSPISVSVMGGIFHNVGQIAMASVVLFSNKIILYLPVLMISGIVTGIITGFIGALILERIKNI